MVDKSLFSSASSEWETPHDLFDRLWEEFGPFDLDPCARPHHHSAKRLNALTARGTIYVPVGGNDNSFFKEDGLAHPWRGRVYMNPPYGRSAGKWVEKAVHEIQCGNAELVVALLPARPDTRWWQTWILCSAFWDSGPLDGWDLDADHRLSLVRFLPGRLKFAGAKNSAPFPSAIVVWRR